MQVVKSEIINNIYIIREQKVMLDKDLALLYGVETKHINQAVKIIKINFKKIFSFN